MKRRLVIDGNAVYEIDEDCMLKRRIVKEKEEERKGKPSVKKEKKD